MKTERDIKDISSDIGRLVSELREYILNTEHWAYYWSSFDEVKAFMKEYPEDFEKKMRIYTITLSYACCFCEVGFEGHPLCIERRKYPLIPLSFRVSVENEYKKVNGELLDIEIRTAEKDIENYNNMLKSAEEKLAELKRRKYAKDTLGHQG